MDILVRREIIEEVVELFRRGEIGYMSIGGIRELRERIVEFEGVLVDEVIVVLGVKIFIVVEIVFVKKVVVVFFCWNVYLLIVC